VRIVFGLRLAANESCLHLVLVPPLKNDIKNSKFLMQFCPQILLDIIKSVDFAFSENTSKSVLCKNFYKYCRTLLFSKSVIFRLFIKKTLSFSHKVILSKCVIILCIKPSFCKLCYTQKYTTSLDNHGIESFYRAVGERELLTTTEQTALVCSSVWKKSCNHIQRRRMGCRGGLGPSMAFKIWHFPIAFSAKRLFF